MMYNSIMPTTLLNLLWISSLEKSLEATIAISQARTKLEIVSEQILKSTAKITLCQKKNKEVVTFENPIPLKSDFQDKKYFEQPLDSFYSKRFLVRVDYKSIKEILQKDVKSIAPKYSFAGWQAILNGLNSRLSL